MDIEVIAEEEDEEASHCVDADGNPIVGDQKEKKKKKTFLKFKDNDGQKTLENPKNITMANFDTQHEVDPLFRKTTQKFDEMRIGNLMTSTLATTATLTLQLDSHMAYISNQKDQETNVR